MVLCMNVINIPTHLYLFFFFFSNNVWNWYLVMSMWLRCRVQLYVWNWVNVYSTVPPSHTILCRFFLRLAISIKKFIMVMLCMSQGFVKFTVLPLEIFHASTGIRKIEFTGNNIHKGLVNVFMCCTSTMKNEIWCA